MKIKYPLTYIVIISILVSLYSCKHENEDPVGLSENHIQLSEKEFTLESKASSVTITTQDDYWWITEVTVDDKNYYYDDFIGSDSAPYSVEKDDISINRSNLRTLNISVKNNQNTSERITKIIVQAGNYFDTITITQQAK